MITKKAEITPGTIKDCFDMILSGNKGKQPPGCAPGKETIVWRTG